MVMVLYSTVNADNIHHNIGAGAGIPFGLLGVSYELETDLNDSISLGPVVSAGEGWNVGLQSHFLDKNQPVRLGLSAWYGTNATVNSKLKNGVTIGMDTRFQFGNDLRNIIDFHILYVASVETPYNIDDVNRVVLSLGYKFRF